MPPIKLSSRFTRITALACCGAIVITAYGQQNPSAPPPDQDDEIVRVSTDLVQTDVMVFDKEGRPVAGLRPEQFELIVDGKPQEVSFFEYIKEGETGKNNPSRAVRGSTHQEESDEADRFRGRVIRGGC